MSERLPFRRAAVFPLLAACACTAGLVACGGPSKPAAAHISTPRATPSPTPSDTPVVTSTATLPPTAMDTFKAQYAKVDTSSWEQASLGMKTADTQQKIMSVLQQMTAALEKYRTAMKGLTPPPDDQLTQPLSQPLAGVVSAISALEAQIRKLEADVQAGNQTAFDNDGNGPYKDAYDALIKADSELGIAVQVDSGG